MGTSRMAVPRPSGVLEVNTSPGLTDHSLAPKAAAREGFPAGPREWKTPHGAAREVAGPQERQTYRRSARGPAARSTRTFRRPVAWALLAAALGCGAYAVWQAVRQQVVTSPHYQLATDAVSITPPPDWVRGDVRGGDARCQRDGPLSVLDENLSRRLYEAFEAHPWVASVERVLKRPPAAVEVELVYRRPGAHGARARRVVAARRPGGAIADGRFFVVGRFTLPATDGHRGHHRSAGRFALVRSARASGGAAGRLADRLVGRVGIVADGAAAGASLAAAYAL